MGRTRRACQCVLYCTVLCTSWHGGTGGCGGLCVLRACVRKCASVHDCMCLCVPASTHMHSCVRGLAIPRGAALHCSHPGPRLALLPPAWAAPWHTAHDGHTRRYAGLLRAGDTLLATAYTASAAAAGGAEGGGGPPVLQLVVSVSVSSATGAWNPYVRVSCWVGLGGRGAGCRCEM